MVVGSWHGSCSPRHMREGALDQLQAGQLPRPQGIRLRRSAHDCCRPHGCPEGAPANSLACARSPQANSANLEQPSDSSSSNGSSSDRNTGAGEGGVRLAGALVRPLQCACDGVHVRGTRAAACLGVRQVASASQSAERQRSSLQPLRAGGVARSSDGRTLTPLTKKKHPTRRDCGGPLDIPSRREALHGRAPGGSEVLLPGLVKRPPVQAAPCRAKKDQPCHALRCESRPILGCAGQ